MALALTPMPNAPAGSRSSAPTVAKCRSERPDSRRSYPASLFPEFASTIFVANRPQFVTELLHGSVSSVARGELHEFGVAGALAFFGLVKRGGVVVGHFDACEW